MLPPQPCSWVPFLSMNTQILAVTTGKPQKPLTHLSGCDCDPVRCRRHGWKGAGDAAPELSSTCVSRGFQQEGNQDSDQWSLPDGTGNDLCWVCAVLQEGSRRNKSLSEGRMNL